MATHAIVGLYQASWTTCCCFGYKICKLRFCCQPVQGGQQAVPFKVEEQVSWTRSRNALVQLCHCSCQSRFAEIRPARSDPVGWPHRHPLGNFAARRLEAVTVPGLSKSIPANSPGCPVADRRSCRCLVDHPSAGDNHSRCDEQSSARESSTCL